MKKALISVSDKTGLQDVAKALVELDYEILSRGGTARALHEAGIPVVEVSDVTKFPEILDGRVKTLHPIIHAGILARGTEEHMNTLKEMDITPIDLVVINLYPFEETIAKEGVDQQTAIENIDIGGPTMVRAAAKNHERVSIVVDPAQYDEVITALKSEEGITLAQRQRLAVARVLLHGSPNHIFDEATSNIDIKSKNAIMGQVKRLARNKTVFLISPGWPMWLTPIRFVCLWQGVISEQGTHEELLSRRGEYAHLWNAQQQLEACRERDK